jgi:hypothetical protein
MNARQLWIAVLGGVLPACAATAQGIPFPQTVIAGSAFSVPTSGSGRAVLYIVGPAQALRRDVQLGSPVFFAAGELDGAGHYLAVIAGGSNKTTEFDVQPAPGVGSLGFLAKPSRLPVNIHDGISGAVYVFDTYRNLVTTPMTATLELTVAGHVTQTRSVTTRNGLAWATMDSAAKESAARFTATVGKVSSTRIINQVPGDTCSISITATPSGNRLEVRTAPVRDCNGNMIPDGTIVTFTESFGNSQSTADVPLKQGIARVEMPANRGAKISVASGVVAGNEIRWDGAR